MHTILWRKKMEELDLKKLINIFWNKRLHIIVISVIAIIIGTIYSFYFVTPKYEAYTTVVLVKDATNGDESTQTITSSDIGLAQNLIGTYSKLVKSKNILRQTINNLQLNETEETLKNKITVSEIEDSEIIKIAVKDENPVQADVHQVAENHHDHFDPGVSDAFEELLEGKEKHDERHAVSQQLVIRYGHIDHFDGLSHVVHQRDDGQLEAADQESQQCVEHHAVLQVLRRFVIFFRKTSVVVQSFLYFCALEVIPLFALWGGLVLISHYLKINF